MKPGCDGGSDGVLVSSRMRQQVAVAAAARLSHRMYLSICFRKSSNLVCHLDGRGRGTLRVKGGQAARVPGRVSEPYLTLIIIDQF